MNVRAGFRPNLPADSAGLANTILAGAQKSGTTSLSRFIGGHPHCLMSEPKEPNFFSRAANLHHIERYRRCFRDTSPEHRVLVDGTTTYMADPAVAPRIRQCLGDDVKIIFILRGPAARTYSSFLHMVKRGHERRTADEVFLRLPDDPEAASAVEHASVSEAALRRRIIRRPYERLYDDVLWNYRYVGNSVYSSLVRSYFAAFRPENILILFFEEVTRDLGAVRRTLGDFLEVDPGLFPEAMAQDNPTRIPDISTPFGWLNEQARRIKRGNFTLVRPTEVAAPLKPSTEIAEKLRRIFATEVEHWSERTGRDMRAIGW